MTDVQQWRRRIHPLHIRIPTSLNESEDKDRSAGTAPSPSTPKKKIKPKISSYFGHHAQPTAQPLKSETSIINVETPATKQVQSPCEPKEPLPRGGPEEIVLLMDTLATKLLTNPFCTLVPPECGAVLSIIEAYHDLRIDRDKMRDEAAAEYSRRCALEEEFCQAQKGWQTEVQEYQAEVKRLEVLISKGNKGLVGVIEARQNSVLRKRSKQPEDSEEGPKETVFEFLKQSREEEERARKAQRGKS